MNAEITALTESIERYENDRVELCRDVEEAWRVTNEANRENESLKAEIEHLTALLWWSDAFLTQSCIVAEETSDDDYECAVEFENELIRQIDAAKAGARCVS